GQEPGPQRAFVPAHLAQLPPGLDRGLLDGVLGRGAVRQHDGREAVRGIEQRLDQAREGVAVPLQGAGEGLGTLLHECSRQLACSLDAASGGLVAANSKSSNRAAREPFTRASCGSRWWRWFC